VVIGSTVNGVLVDTLDEVAAAIAWLITTDTRTAALPFTALSEGATLLIVNRDGAGFTPSFAVGSVSGYAFSSEIALSGDVVAGHNGSPQSAGCHGPSRSGLP
jgi:hypothetical protein